MDKGRAQAQIVTIHDKAQPVSVDTVDTGCVPNGIRPFPAGRAKDSCHLILSRYIDRAVAAVKATMPTMHHSLLNVKPLIASSLPFRCCDIADRDAPIAAAAAAAL